MATKIPQIEPPQDARSLDWLRRWLERMRLWVQTRDPSAPTVGDPREKFVTRGELQDQGLLARQADGTFVGTGGGGTTTIVFPGGVGGSDSIDLTAPPVPTGLTVVAGATALLITIDAPTYTVGHGPGRTNYYAAVWADGDPEPTFGDVRTKPIGSTPGASPIYAYAGELNTTYCVWATFTTVDGVEGSPAGGTNGVQGTTNAGGELQDAVYALQIIADQILGGSISVGEYIQSAGFVSGTSGWRIDGAGTAEFGAATIRGQLTVNQIEVGAATITYTTTAGPITITGETGVPTGTFTDVISYTWTPPVDCKVEVFVDGAAQMTTPGSGASTAEYATLTTRLLVNGTQVGPLRTAHSDDRIGYGYTKEAQVIRGRIFDAVGGVSLTVTLQAQKLDPAVTTSIDDIFMRLTEFRR